MLALLLGAPEAGAYDGWIGSIHFHDDHKEKSSYSTPQNSVYHVGASCRHESVADAYVKACFSKGALVDARARAHYDLTHEESCDWFQDHEICCGGVAIDGATWADRKKGCDRVTPGDKGKVDYDRKGVRVGDPKIKRAGLDVSGTTGNYFLTLSGEIPAREKITDRGKARLVCSGKERSESPPFKVYDSDKYFGFSAEGKVNGDTIKDQRTLVDIQDVPEGPFCFARGCSVRGLGPVLDASKEKKQRTMRVTARWYFKKTDCFGVVNMAKGDVRIKPPVGAGEFPGGDWVGPEGWPAELGCVDVPKGTIIETGAKSRVSLAAEDVEIRLGSESRAELSKLCPSPGETPGPGLLRLLAGHLVHLVFGDGEFIPIVCNAVNGRRGQTPREEGIRLARAVLDALIPPARAKQLESPSLVTESDLATAKVAVMVERQPGFLDVEVLKGNIIVEYGEATLRLGPGEHFTKRWVLPVDDGAYKRLVVRAGDSVDEVREAATPAGPCEMLKRSRTELDDALGLCEAVARQDPRQTSQCELLKQQVEQLDVEIKRLCP